MAAEYDPHDPGTHRLVILDISGKPHEWNNNIPAAWRPTSIDEVELVVVIGPEIEIWLGTQDYFYPSGKRAPSISRYQRVLDVTVYEARTGNTLWIQRLEGPLPDRFPATAPEWQIRLIGDHVASSSLVEWLECKVTTKCTNADIVIGHASWIDSAAFSPDGMKLATGESNGDVRIWNASNGILLHTLKGHTERIMALAFTPDGEILASGSSDTTIRVWQVSNGTLKKTLEGHAAQIWDVDFSPDGKTLASASSDNTVRLWSVTDGSLLQTLKHKSSVYSVAFTPDGQLLASGVFEGGLRLWNIKDGTVQMTLHNGITVSNIAISPDGNFLALGIGSTIEIRRFKDAAILHTFPPTSNVDSIHCLKFSLDSLSLASGGNGKVEIWHVVDGSLLGRLELAQHPSSPFVPYALEVAFSPDGTNLRALIVEHDPDKFILRTWLLP